jgi:EpsD family peptidyl-prolyl cis-trans isomerase
MTLVFGTTLGLAACGNKTEGAARPLARVNGTEITLTQFNDELKREGVKPEHQEGATRQLLESLIDRHLLLAEAMRSGIDHSADVVQAIEHAKMQIITRAYIERLGANVTRPSLAEIADYYQKHPEYFVQRKQFDVQQLVVAARDFSNDLRSVVDSARSLDSVAAWLDKHNVPYVRGQLSRSTTDLPEQMAAKLKSVRTGQVFIVTEGEHSQINLIINIKTDPITAKSATPQIEHYLFNKRIKEAAEAEIKRLRASARIEYLNPSSPTVH